MTKSELIKAVRQAAELWDAAARSDAREAVLHLRAPNAHELMDQAERSVAASEAAHTLEQRVIELVEGNWPT